MKKLIHKIDDIKVPEELVKRGYLPPASIGVYQIGEDTYRIGIGIDWKDGLDPLDMVPTTQPNVIGKEKAISRAQRIKEEIESGYIN